MLLSAAWLAGCEMTANNVDIPQTQSKLVVTCFISPRDTLLTVNVNRSVPIYGTPSVAPELSDGTVVTLSDGTATVRLSLDVAGTPATSDRFIASARNLPIRPGGTYFLSVTTPDGLRASASCTVPERASDQINIRLDSVQSSNGSPDSKEYSLSVEWQDAPGEGDYYRVFAERTLGRISQCPPGQPCQVSISYSPVYFQQGDVYTADAGQDGRRFIVREGKFSYYSSGSSGQPERKVDVMLLTTDRNYYEYHRKLDQYSEDNPFAEPTPLYSNVVGGLGIFAAYQLVKQEIRY